MTIVGVGDGLVSKLVEDGSDLVQLAWSFTPVNPKYWTETLPQSFALGQAIAKGDITYEDIKECLGEAVAQQFAQPFEDIKSLSNKVFTGKATYEESVQYGRALAQALEAVTIVVGAAKSGVKIAAKTGDKLSKVIPDVYEQVKPSSKVNQIETGNLIFKSAGEYFSYITEIGRRTDLTSEQKFAKILEAYAALGIKGDVTVVSDIKFLKPE